MSLTLSPPELRELVGLAKSAKATPLELQKRLCAQGIPFRVVGSRILVSREAAEKWLRGQRFDERLPDEPAMPRAPGYQGSGLQAHHQAIAEDRRRAADVAEAWRAQHAQEIAARQDAIRRAATSHRSAKRRTAEMRRTPAWADASEIAKVYEEAARRTAETGVEHHVDHEIPLQGRLVSGLHVHQNLRVIPAGDNIRKGNSFEIDA